nr:hypothetical protein [Kibdelosporangium sp. MJ126-NF4]CEL16269.1 hypothetical protein [Kibdelosporangium sp. MJ126-NF4]CTQ94193.1 hypothetical protein [Kibdelosporangium sp. MJ126-NF4]
MFGKDTTPSSPDNAGRTRAVVKLEAALRESRRLQRLLTDPLLVAVRAERLRVSVTGCLWFFLACGLGFTAAGVQAFLADGYTVADPQWWAAWLVEPCFAGILITVLRWEANILAWGSEVAARVVGRLKGLLMFATLVMNVVPTLWPPGGHPVNPGNVFVHLIIPVIVYLIAEVIPEVQRTCTHVKQTAAAMTSPEIPEDSGPAVTAAVPGATAPARVPRVKLPPAVLTQIRNALDIARRQDRVPTVEDITRVVSLPDITARQLLADLTRPMNGHTAPD